MERYVYCNWIQDASMHQAQRKCEQFSAKVIDNLDGKDSTFAILAERLKPRESFLIGVSDQVRVLAQFLAQL